jgi:biotin carboxylase
VGVHICDDRAGLEEAFFGDIASARDRNGDSAEVLVQEYIDGDEYVVNTVSCRGVHKVTGVMVYKKILLPEMAPLYYTMSTFSPESDEARQVIDYTLKALDAIGVEYGPVHSEIMIDEKGPVLIEANCRLCGATMLASWQDKVFGERESRTSLRAYLHPERFLSDTRRILMDAELTGIIRFLILEKEMFVRKNKVAEAFSGIEGFEYAFGMGDGRLYPKTVDLSTTGGMVYLAHRSREALQNSLELIRKIELEEPERIYDV